MTVSSTTNRKEYTGNGVTVTFAASPVTFFATSDLEVYVVTTATGAATLLTENTDYTVTTPVPFDGTGTVDLSGGASPYGAPSASQKLVIVRNLPLTQETDFVQNDSSDAEVAEDTFDRQTMVSQQLSVRLDRSFRLSDSDVSGVDLVLPEVADRADKFMSFNSTGALVMSIGTDGTGGSLSTALALTTAGNGASLIGIQDSGALFAATTVEAALAETATALNVDEAALAAHIADTTDAHDASAISYVGGTGMSATDVEAAIDELATEKLDVTAFTLAGLGVTASAAELNIMDGVTATAAELNILDGVTSTAAELNLLDGVTATTTEINGLDLSAKTEYRNDFHGTDTLGGLGGTDPQVNFGTPAAGAGQNGVFELVTGDDVAASMAVNGAQGQLFLDWRADAGGLFAEFRVKTDAITTLALFIGFTDQIAALEMPFTLAAGDALTSNATDAVGVLFDTAADTDNWWLVGVANNVDATKQNVAVAPVAGTYETWRIEISAAGAATFYRNGSVIGTAMTGAVTPTVLLTPVVAAFSRAAASRTILLDYLHVQANRV